MGKYCKITIAMTLVIIIYYIGTVHIVIGGAWTPICKTLLYNDIENCMVIEKDSWGLRESIIDYNRLSKLPFIVAKSEYPLFIFWIEGQIGLKKLVNETL